MTQGPEIKGLEWVKHPTAEAWRCDTIVGLYQVFAIVTPGTWTLDGPVGRNGEGSAISADEAKAAAQADYETRIRSALAPSVVAEPTQTSGSNNVPPGTPLNAPSVFGFGVPSPHKGEPDVLRDAVAILKRLSILRIPPYDLPADSFLEKAATEIITLVLAATPNHPEPGAGE